MKARTMTERRLAGNECNSNLTPVCKCIGTYISIRFRRELGVWVGGNPTPKNRVGPLECPFLVVDALELWIHHDGSEDSGSRKGKSSPNEPDLNSQIVSHY
jgi:hypothetical protein